MISSTLIIVIILAIIIWLWQSSMQAKELATKACKILCKDNQVQLLDQTVSLKKIRLKRNNAGHMSIWRKYEFDYSKDSADRFRGYIELLGNTLIAENITIFNPEVKTTTIDQETTGKVLQFKKRD